VFYFSQVGRFGLSCDEKKNSEGKLQLMVLVVIVLVVCDNMASHTCGGVCVSCLHTVLVLVLLASYRAHIL